MTRRIIDVDKPDAYGKLNDKKQLLFYANIGFAQR